MPLGNQPPMPKHKPGPAKAFPKNVEPRGKQRFGPAARSERATQENRFNVDKHGRRPAMKPPGRVR